MVTRSFFLFILFAAFLFAACASAGRDGGASEGLQEPAKPAENRKDAAVREAPREKKEVPAREPQVLRVGLVLPLTGDLSSFGQAVLEGAIVARKELQNGRGLAVRFEIVDNREDHATGSVESVEIARRLLEKDVCAVIGPLTTPCVVATALALARDSVLVISPTSSAYEVGRASFNAFSLSSPCPSLSRQIAAFAVRELDVSRFAVLYPADPYGEIMSRAFVAEAERQGATIAIAVPFAPSQTTFEREVRMIGLYNPHALFLPARSEDIVQIAPQIPYYGTRDILLLGTDGWNYEGVPREGGAYVEGAYFCDSFSSESPRLGWEEFSGSYINEFHKEPTKVAAWGYDALTMIADSFARAGSVRPGSLLEAFTSRAEFAGASAIYHMSGGHFDREGFLFTISGGEIVSLESEHQEPTEQDSTGTQGG